MGGFGESGGRGGHWLRPCGRGWWELRAREGDDSIRKKAGKVPGGRDRQAGDSSRRERLLGLVPASLLARKTKTKPETALDLPQRVHAES